jgi:hypothetical protein
MKFIDVVANEKHIDRCARGLKNVERRWLSFPVINVSRLCGLNPHFVSPLHAACNVF